MQLRGRGVGVREAPLGRAEVERDGQRGDLLACGGGAWGAWAGAGLRGGGGRWDGVGRCRLALFDAAAVGRGRWPETLGFEVGDGAAGGVLAGGLFGAELGVERAEGGGVAFDFHEAGPAVADLVVGVCWLGGGSGALEL